MECVVLKRLCLSGPRPKTLPDFDVEMKPSWLILKGRIRPARIYGFRPGESSYRRNDIFLRSSADNRPLQCLAVIPGHPLRRLARQFLRMPLQFAQIVERVGTA